MSVYTEIREQFRERIEKDKHASGYPFITISRQAGAGGHALAVAIKRLADERNYADLFNEWRVFDQELCEQISKDPQFHVSLEALLAEEFHTEFQEFVTALIGGPDEQYRIYKRMFRTVLALGAIGKNIIVGRAGNMVTRRLPGGIHLRLVAPMEVRVQRMAELFKVDETEARQMIDTQDEDRARMIKSFFSRNIDDASLYHEVWDTGETPIEEFAAKAIDLISDKAKAIGYA